MPTIRSKLFELLYYYDTDAINKVARDAGVRSSDIQRWISGEIPHGDNYEFLDEAYRTKFGNAKPRIGASPLVPKEGADSSPNSDTDMLPSSGKLPDTILIILTAIKTSDRLGETKEWAVGRGIHGKTVFISTTHLQMLRDAGGKIGSKFMAVIGPTAKRDTSLEFETKELDLDLS
jgi:hypothetical protein